MAAVTRVNPSLATPTGEARIRRGRATVDFLKGQVATVDGSATPGFGFETAWKKATAETNALGLVLKDVKTGGTVEVVIAGEVGGYTGLPEGAFLSVATGELNDTAPAGASRFYAYSDTVVIIL
jgi:hypothetical protein